MYNSKISYWIFPSAEGDYKKQEILNLTMMFIKEDPKKREEPTIILDKIIEELPSSK